MEKGDEIVKNLQSGAPLLFGVKEIIPKIVSTKRVL